MALLTILLGLALLWMAVHRPAVAKFAALPVLLLCVYAGLTLPDIDQPLPLDHRSALTHSIVPALLLLRRWARPAAAGLMLGIGIHLAADVFPNEMVGFATVKLPFAGSIGWRLSYVWLAGNALACSLLGGWLLSRVLVATRQRAFALLAAGLIGVIYLFSVDGGWQAMAVYLGAGWLVLRKVRPA